MALEQFNLNGQVAIVTGAGKGVGQGIARVLAEAGATVVGTARTESDIRATIAGLEEAGFEQVELTPPTRWRTAWMPPSSRPSRLRRRRRRVSR